MAEQKRGPVKPPTLDLKAKPPAEAGPAQQGGSPGGGSATGPEPATPTATGAAKGAGAPPEKTDNRAGTGQDAPKPDPNKRADDKSRETDGVANKGAKPETLDAPASAGNRAAGVSSSAQSRAAPGKSGSTPDKAGSGDADNKAHVRAQTPDKATPEAKKSKGGAALFSAMLGAAIVGGALGVGGAYGLAYFGYWPQAAAPTGFATTDALRTQGAQLDERLSALEASTKAGLAQLGDADQGLKKSVGELSAAVKGAPDPTQTANQLAALETEITDLKQRVTQAAKAPAPSSAAAPAAQAAITSLETEISGLKSAVAQLEQTVQTQGSQAGEMAAGLKSTQQALDSFKAKTETVLAKTETVLAKVESGNADARAQLPVALSEMSGAIENGAPYAEALSVVQKALPQLQVPAAIVAGAGGGLGDPANMQVAFERAIPAVLGAAPANAQASWQDKLVSKMTGLLAIRPAQPVSGDSPQALVSQLEAALSARDFSKAVAVYKQMPGPMQKASTLELSQLENLAVAEEFIRSARQAALSNNTGGSK